MKHKQKQVEYEWILAIMQEQQEKRENLSDVQNKKKLELHKM